MEIRQENTHDVSRHWRISNKINTDKRKDPYYNFDLELKIIIPDLIKNITSIYEILETVLIKNKELINNNINILVPTIMKNFDINSLDNVIQTINRQSQITIDNIENLNFDYIELIQNLDSNLFTDTEFHLIHTTDISNLPHKITSKMLYSDTVFRMKESIKCLTSIANCNNNTLYRDYPFDKDILNEQYFTYAAIFRIYGCYDKIGRIIKDMLKLQTKSKYVYFEDIVNIIFTSNLKHNSSIVNCIKNIYVNTYFKELCKLRNRLFHYIRLGVLYGKDGMDIFDNRLVKLVFENANLIKLLLKEIECHLINNNSPS